MTIEEKLDFKLTAFLKIIVLGVKSISLSDYSFGERFRIQQELDDIIESIDKLTGK